MLAGESVGFGSISREVLPPLLEIIPEARMNMVIYYLRTDEVRPLKGGGDGRLDIRHNWNCDNPM